MDDIDIEPPEAPVLQDAPDEIPLPPPSLQKKKGFFGKLFEKKAKTQTTNSPPVEQMPPPPAPVEQMPPPSLADPPSGLPTFDQMATPEPPEPGSQEELLPLPDLDNFYHEHAEELEQLKKKLGDEFVVPPEDQDQITIELDEKPTIGQMLKKKPAQEPMIIELETPEEKNTFLQDEQPRQASSPSSSFLSSSPARPSILPASSSSARSSLSSSSPPPAPPRPSSTLLGMKGRVEKRKVTIDAIATEPDPFAAFKEQEKMLATTPELPDPLPVGRYLSDDEIRQVISGLEKGSYATYSKTIASYLDSLEAELAEIVKSPYAKGKAKKPGTANSTLFFKLHKAANTGELIKLLKTIEFIYKVDLNTLAIRNGKDIEEWLTKFIEAERAKEDRDFLEKQLTYSFDSAFKEFKRSVEREKHELDFLYARLLKEKEAIETHKKELTSHRENLVRDKENHDSLVDAKVAAVQAEFARKELGMRKEYEARFQKLEKTKEEFERLKKRQDLDIYSELQKVEKLKTTAEGEAFTLEEDKSQFEKDRKAFRLEQKNTIDTAKKQLVEMREEEKDLRKAIIDERTRLEKLQKDFDERVKRQYFTMSNNLGKEKGAFQEFRNAELDKLTLIRQALEKEKTDITAIKNELTRQEERIKAIINEQKAQVREDLDEMRKIDMNLEQVEVNIRNQKEVLEHEGFQKYIQAKLQEVNPGSLDHVELAHTVVEEHEFEKALYKDLSDLIDECKQLLAEDKLAEAKILYNTIRQRYASSDLTKNEKSLLHNQIRELYDDIHLHDL